MVLGQSGFQIKMAVSLILKQCFGENPIYGKSQITVIIIKTKPDFPLCQALGFLMPRLLQVYHDTNTLSTLVFPRNRYF